MSYLLGLSSSGPEKPYDFEQDPNEASSEVTGKLTVFIKNPEGTTTIYRVTRIDGPCMSGYTFSTYMSLEKETPSEEVSPDILFPEPTEGQTEESDDPNAPMVFWFRGAEEKEDFDATITTLTFTNKSQDFEGTITISDNGGDGYYPNGSVMVDMGPDFNIGDFEAC